MMTLILIPRLAAADVPCTVPVPDNTGDWKPVSATNVTLCVPAAWRVRGTRASYSGGTIRWRNTSSQGTARQSSVPRKMRVGRMMRPIPGPADTD